MAMNCPKCGSVIPEGAGFCTVCGTRIENVKEKSGNQPAYVTPQSAQSILASVDPTSSLNGNASPAGPVGSAAPMRPTSYVASTGAVGFVDPAEKAICSLKNGYSLNMISGEGWKSEDSVITDKRLYYYGNEGVLSKLKQEEIVNLEDITGVSITYFRPWLLVIVGALFAVGCLAMPEFMLKILFLIFAALCLLTFAALCKSFLKIEYAGGSIHFSVKKYGLDNVRVFQRCIFTQKDKLK